MTQNLSQALRVRKFLFWAECCVEAVGFGGRGGGAIAQKVSVSRAFTANTALGSCFLPFLTPRVQSTAALVSSLQHHQIALESRGYL